MSDDIAAPAPDANEDDQHAILIKIQSHTMMQFADLMNVLAKAPQAVGPAIAQYRAARDLALWVAKELGSEKLSLGELIRIMDNAQRDATDGAIVVVQSIPDGL